MAATVCWSCEGSNTTYQSFSGGQEYYCFDCDDCFPYRDERPRRVQMLADGQGAELRDEMLWDLQLSQPTESS